MDKRIKFSDQPKRVKILYTAVIGVLCITALVIGIMSAASKSPEIPEDDPTANLPSGDESPDNSDKEDGGDNDGDKENEKPAKFTMVSPVVGSITKHHSIDTPVFSNTLNEWRVHTGIDISADEGSQVYAAASGVVSRIYNDALYGKTVEITHENGIVSVYANLSSSGIAVSEGDEVASGAVIGLIGDTSLSELADEAHLHFAVKVEGVSVNPLDYISEESKQASLGITDV